MNDSLFLWHRYATITALTERAPQGLGRTALMKLCYFLQVLRKVDLGYDFRLYMYGPFDSQVLDDLSYSKFLEAVDEKTVAYSGGHGYVIRPAGESTTVKSMAGEFIAKNEPHFDWVMSEFGSYSAADLELLSTMVFVDREALEKEENLAPQELVRRVLQLKPHFAEEYALRLTEVLKKKGALQATQSG